MFLFTIVGELFTGCSSDNESNKMIRQAAKVLSDIGFDMKITVST